MNLSSKKITGIFILVLDFNNYAMEIHEYIW